MDDLAVVILAAGGGTRFNEGKPSILPKVLFKIAGRPMISYTLSTISKLEPSQIIFVVGYKAQEIKDVLGSSYEYAFQKQALGTANAAQCSTNLLKPQIKKVLILNGDDSAFYSARTLESLVLKHNKEGNVLTFATLIKGNPFGIGRVVRSKGGELLKIVEEKVASEEEKKIREINIGCYLIERDWFCENISKVTKSSVGEYYLTDLVEIALEGKKKVGTFKLDDSNEWKSINCPEELEVADCLMKKRLKK